ncbi:TraB/GumN family protein [Pontixanthobacter gangjinensis]|uniref:TraB family protein n=1 Tax=Pontixanthobacter gangjinensis TaxID=1028742 RepID=A0A6I4SMS4_9SPHN|nr:TraB/GumN family protein [Pontixanthobacter gangjinensis]MXO57043.1 hypothetical protein [Pontixanthobacter gangjinensis]
MKLFISCFAISALFMLPASTGFADERCNGKICGPDTNIELKAKRKGGYRDGQSPEELAEAEQIAFDAAVEANVFKPVIQDYEPSPAIWKLADEDTTIYMFGTFHILPQGFQWRSDAFNAIVQQVDELVVETSDADSEESLGEVMEEMFSDIFSDERTPVSERISAENKEKWLRLGELADMPGPIFDRMPLFLSLMGAGLSISEQAGSSGEYGVETVLEAEFKEASKPIGSIEDSGAVMSALIGVDEDKLIIDLDKDLREWDGVSLASMFEIVDDNGDEEAGPFRSEHLWAQGKLDELAEDEFGDSEVGREIYRILITDRNRAWAMWLDDRLNQPGTILLAVGAAHFEGPDSVLNMLKERDLSANRLN